MQYDLAIVGGGPAGAAAGVYAARKQLRTVLITKEWGGQSAVSPDIQNWIGTISISGEEFAKSLEAHVKAYAEDCVDIIEGRNVEQVGRTDGGEGFSLTDEQGETYTASTALLTPGARRRKLSVPGADEFENKGVMYCASCDGPMFKGMDVAVVGGGNAGFEAAAQLLAYANSVTLFHRHQEFRADPTTVEKVLAKEHMTALPNTEPIEIHGEQFVSGVTYRNTETGEEHRIDVNGVFVEIGLIPNTGLAAELLELDEANRFVVDPRNNRASVAGIWAAGDCTSNRFHQNNIAAGDAVRALEDVYGFLST